MEQNINVFLYQDPNLGSPNPAELSAKLDDRITLTAGGGIPNPAGYHILIAAIPLQGHLDASPNLHSLIIPYSGIPAATQALLKQYPQIAVHNTPYNYIASAETALSLVLGSAKFVAKGDRNLRRNDWTLRYSEQPQIVLHGRTVLILGYGRIGRHVGMVLNALGMDVIGVRRTVRPEDSEDAFAEVHSFGQLEALLPRADVMVMALPATSETDEMIGERELSLLPDEAILVNIGRSSTLNETALYNALVSGKLAAAGIDVWYNYPSTIEERLTVPPSQYPFHELKNVILSPHRSGWLGKDSSGRVAMLSEMLNAIARGEPLPNPVNLELGY
ncbi:MAG: NAD(P)-dependent oxidoreductase [Chloroflexota bacterium]